MKGKHFCIAVTTALALLFVIASSAAAHAHTPAPPPAINSANFVRHVTNTFFPPRPGTTFFSIGEVVEKKYYAQGIGIILEVVVTGGNERSELVRMSAEECPEN